MENKKKKDLQTKITKEMIKEIPYLEYDTNIEGTIDIFKYKISKVRISEVETEDIHIAINSLNYNLKELEKINQKESWEMIEKTKAVKKTIAIIDFEIESISNDFRIFELTPINNAKINNDYTAEWLLDLGMYPEHIYEKTRIFYSRFR